MKNPNQKEQLWLNALFESKDLNLSEATRKVYSSKNPDVLGSQIADRPHIRAAINEFNAKRMKRTEIKADYVLTEAVKAFEVCAKQTQNEGGDTVLVNPAAASKFLELIGKHTSIKAFEDTIIAPSGINLVINRPDAIKPDNTAG